MSIDSTASPEEIAQAEEVPFDARPVAVAVAGPVEVRELPAPLVGYQTVPAVGTAVGVRLVPFEPRRKGGYLLALSQDIWISTSQAGAQMGASSAARWPAMVPYPITHLEEIWACAVTGTTDISIQCDYWSA